MELTVWHNPKCSKCRATLEILEQRDAKLTVREYLSDSPAKGELAEVVGLLGGDAHQLVRKKEALYKELGLEGADNDRVLTALADNPSLIERPVVFDRERAVIARPPENVNALFD